VIDLAIVGCGDVAFRTYLPGLALIADRARVVACFDPQTERAERLAAEAGGARVYSSYPDLLAHPGLDAILNLTPAPFHRDITSAALDAGLHCFSEKPLASDVPQAQALIAQARRRERLLLCAPGVMATSRFRWLRDELAAGRFGRPTLAVGQMANMGPAGWLDYRGDPAVFYSKSVGPLLDTGVYILHAITGLFGPARRVEAFGGIAIPQRTVLIPDRAGQTIEVEANDHMLLHLDFGNATFAQVLSSFAVPRSRAPALELHGSIGSISISQDLWYAIDEPIDLLLPDVRSGSPASWTQEAPPTAGPVPNLIQAGPAHFVACLLGEETPILTAEHACHVLEIILTAERSVREGRALDLETTFS
jgi:predicted dehydrogenase